LKKPVIKQTTSHNNSHQPNNYRGRFAPSPSGELHFGSLLAAMASYADARAHQGQWLLRIDDIDQARVVPDSTEHIIQTLAQLGFEWDEEILDLCDSSSCQYIDTGNKLLYQGF